MTAHETTPILRQQLIRDADARKLGLTIRLGFRAIELPCPVYLGVLEAAMRRKVVAHSTDACAVSDIFRQTRSETTLQCHVS